MKTHQLNTRINAEAYSVLEGLSKKLHTTKAYLVEKAIYHLQGQFNKLEKTPEAGKKEDLFLSLLAKSMDQYNYSYKRLAK